MSEAEFDAVYPAQLMKWAGNRSGGVRRLFDNSSGRPGEQVFQTSLLSKLRAWASDFSKSPETTPRILLLVGGPGNGKTEAIESTVGWLDAAVDARGSIVAELQTSFLPKDGGSIPRLVKVDIGFRLGLAKSLCLSIVQDASTVIGDVAKPAAQLFLEELAAARSSSCDLYLCCINRGILDDALIRAIDGSQQASQALLEAITAAVSLAPEARACWPLAEFPDVAVWPMDMESLLVPVEAGGISPAKGIVEKALDKDKWPAVGGCAAGSECPFCISRKYLSRDRDQSSLLQILRWYEIAYGKRWNFRDLFSLTSYLLAGHRNTSLDMDLTPCEWAAELVSFDKKARAGHKPKKVTSTAIFRLVSMQYQHALFHRWDTQSANTLAREARELGLADDNTVKGLQWFLGSRGAPYLPTMIGDALNELAEGLDPALADPNAEVQITSMKNIALREIDTRFSRSVNAGLAYVRSFRVLSVNEIDLLARLEMLDEELSNSKLRKKKPASASNIQKIVRDFSCRLVRRSLGARMAIVPDVPILADFQRVLEGSDGDDLYDVAREVEGLLNRGQNFEISLTTTFGQPLPSSHRSATLVIPLRRVSPYHLTDVGRPISPVCYLKVGDRQTEQPIPLTYDLFKAIKELEKGLSIASLPRAVVALLDTTRAKLSGTIVRDNEILDRAHISFGSNGTTIRQRRTRFIAQKEGGAQ